MNSPKDKPAFSALSEARMAQMQIGVLTSIAQAVGQIAHNTGPTVGHLPVVVPLKDGGYGVVCFACTDASEGDGFIYPCLVAPEMPIWPTSQTLVEPTKVGVGTISAKIDKALKMVRSRFMDQPSDSPEAKWLQEVIGVLTGS